MYHSTLLPGYATSLDKNVRDVETACCKPVNNAMIATLFPMMAASPVELLCKMLIYFHFYMHTCIHTFHTLFLPRYSICLLPYGSPLLSVVVEMASSKPQNNAMMPTPPTMMLVKMTVL